jgi:hypothetical protein
VHDLSVLGSRQIRGIIEPLAVQEVDYRLDKSVGEAIMQRIGVLFDDIRENPLQK